MSLLRAVPGLKLTIELPDISGVLFHLAERCGSTEERTSCRRLYCQSFRMEHASTTCSGHTKFGSDVRTGLIVLNIGRIPTFRRPGCEDTIPELTFATESLLSAVKPSWVLPDFLKSGRQYISIKITSDFFQCFDVRQITTSWNVEKEGKWTTRFGREQKNCDWIVSEQQWTF